MTLSPTEQEAIQGLREIYDQWAITKNNNDALASLKNLEGLLVEKKWNVLHLLFAIYRESIQDAIKNT